MLTHLQKHFNFSSFRPGQEEIVKNIIDGKDVVALMPTGGGKSLCFQLPSIISGKLTVVISPLIALMKDQVDSLNARGIPAVFINSSLDPSEVGKVIDGVKSGKVKLLYVAPERLSNPRFKGVFSDLEVDFLAIDEAHCVSQWGHDFRPDYMKIRDFINGLKNRPAVGAFTATATPEVRDDIVKNLALNNPKVFVRGFDRPNLKFFVQAGLKKNQRKEEVLRIIKTLPGSGIVYTISRKETEAMADFLNDNNITAIAYHAGMPGARRTGVQNDFMENKYKVIVATIAFGMGVDKADVRFVLHCGMPSTLEGYYQEAGRAGRDGEKAFCILLQSGRDNSLHHFFIRKSKEEMLRQGKSWDEISAIMDVKYRKLDRIKEYVETSTCRRKVILEYFADPDLENYQDNCGGCDVCMNYKWDNAAAPRQTQGKRKKRREQVSNTIMETIKLYKQDYTPEQIAKARSLGVTTIYTHLINWYLEGGNLEIEKFVTKDEESQILNAMAKVEDYQRLSPIKEHLPEDISYEKIKLVVAKIQRIKLG